MSGVQPLPGAAGGVGAGAGTVGELDAGAGTAATVGGVLVVGVGDVPCDVPTVVLVVVTAGVLAVVEGFWFAA